MRDFKDTCSKAVYIKLWKQLKKWVFLSSHDQRPSIAAQISGSTEFRISFQDLSDQIFWTFLWDHCRWFNKFLFRIYFNITITKYNNIICHSRIFEYKSIFKKHFLKELVYFNLRSLKGKRYDLFSIFSVSEVAEKM